MSKLADHLLQTTPLVLAASLVAQQGANATEPPVAENADPAPAVETQQSPQPEEFQWEPSILAADYQEPTPVPQPAAIAPAPVAVSPPPAPEPVVAAPVPAPAPQPEPIVAAPAPAPQPEPITVEPAVESPTTATLNDFEPHQAGADALEPIEGVEQEYVVEPESETTADLNEVQPEVEQEYVVEPEAEVTADFPDLPTPQPVQETADAELDELDQGELEPALVSEPSPAAVDNSATEIVLPTSEAVETETVITPETAPTVEIADDGAEPTIGTSGITTTVEPPALQVEESTVGTSGITTTVEPPVLQVEEPTEATAATSGITTTVEPPALQVEESTVGTSGITTTVEPLSASASEESEAAIASTETLPEPELEGLDELELNGADPALELWDERELDGSEEVAELTVQDLLEQVNDYSTEDINGSLGQGVLGASQFSDVSPADWAYTALDDLVRRYDCLKGYPNGTYRGNRSLSRYEFAAGLNSCIQQVERLIAETTADMATTADLEVMQRLVQEFESEIANLNARVDGMEGRVAFLEDHQFSTTTKLEGEVLFALGDLFTESQAFDSNYDGTIDASDSTFSGSETVFQDRVRLNLLTSFTGRDRLHTRLQGRNAQQFDPFTGTVTYEGGWGFASNSNGENNVTISDLAYQFLLGENLLVQIAAKGMSPDEWVDTLNPFDSTGGGAISKFGQYNPIYRTGNTDAGVAVTFSPNEKLALHAGYANATPADATSGVFNGSYNFTGQATFRPTPNIGVAATFVHAFDEIGDDSTLALSSFDTGSRGANLARRTGQGLSLNQGVTNSFGLQALVDVNDKVFVGGWVGYSEARMIGVGDAEIWNYAGFVGVNDLGGTGNQLGVIVGMEPRLESVDAAVGTPDRSTGLHVEGFYKIKVNKNVEITPGIIWLTAPDHNSANPDMVAGVVRTRFKF